MSSKLKRGREDDSTCNKKSRTFVNVDVEHLKCPICFDYPRKEVYSCSEGHVICSQCIQNLDKCPSCRLSYNGMGGKTRTRFAENILDSLLLDCSWKDNGCTAPGFKRQELADHEIQCSHNPSLIKICSIIMFGDVSCPFEVTRASLEDETQVKKLLEHLKSVHDFNVFEEVNGGGYMLEVNRCFLLRETYPFHKPEHPGASGSNCNRSVLAYHHKAVTRLLNSSGNQIGLYMMLVRVDKMNDDSDFKKSWICVRLTPENSTSSSVTVKVTVVNPTKSNVSTDTSQLSWTVQQIDLFKLKTLRETKRDDLPKFGFSLPKSLICENYLDNEGNFHIKVHTSIV